MDKEQKEEGSRNLKTLQPSSSMFNISRKMSHVEKNVAGKLGERI
jgi:hypothetical protein